MAQILAATSRFPSLASRVVVLTGGASGIGAALTTFLRSHGAHVFFGDISFDTGKAVESQPPTQERSSGTAKFVPCDVSKYTDIYALFRAAYDAFGYIDHAVSCAGVLERGRFFDDPDLTIESIAEDPGDTSVLEINSTGSLHFARIASVFMRQPFQPPSSAQAQASFQSEVKDKSITFLSSIAGIRDSPGMPLYQTSKVATLGLLRGMRSLDLSFPLLDGNSGKIRVNALCPGMTESAMTSHLIPKFQAAQRSAAEKGEAQGCFWQTSADVAAHIAHLMVDDGMHGKSVYVEGGKGWDFEDGLKASMDVWLGEEPAGMLRGNVEFIRSLGGIRKD